MIEQPYIVHNIDLYPKQINTCVKPMCPIVQRIYVCYALDYKTPIGLLLKFLFLQQNIITISE